MRRLAILFACLSWVPLLPASSLDALLAPQDPHAKPPQAEMAVPAVASEALGASEFRLPPARLLEALREELIAHYQLEGNLQIIPTQPLPELRLPTDDFSLVFTTPLPERLNPSTTLRFQVLSDGQAVRQVVAPLRLEHWVEAYLCRTAVPRGQTLREEDFSVEGVDSLRQRYPLVPAGMDLTSYRTTAVLSPARVLTWTQIEPLPAVRKGELVEAVAAEGALLITLKVQALEDGQPGEFIRVRNLQSEKEFQAQVTHDNRLQVHF